MNFYSDQHTHCSLFIFRHVPSFQNIEGNCNRPISLQFFYSSVNKTIVLSSPFRHRHEPIPSPTPTRFSPAICRSDFCSVLPTHLFLFVILFIHSFSPPSPISYEKRFFTTTRSFSLHPQQNKPFASGQAKRPQHRVGNWGRLVFVWLTTPAPTLTLTNIHNNSTPTSKTPTTRIFWTSFDTAPSPTRTDTTTNEIPTSDSHDPFLFTCSPIDTVFPAIHFSSVFCWSTTTTAPHQHPTRTTATTESTIKSKRERRAR